MVRSNAGRWPLNLIGAALAACFAPGASALPTDPGVVAGNASFAQSGNALTVTNSSGTIINWNSFSIGSGESVRFIQPDASSSVMNRVLAADPSVLLGSLQSNGKVFLINPAGITVGAGARIDVAGFFASSLTLTDEDFLAGRLNFVATPGAAAVRVADGAEIATPSGGQVYLIAPQVENAGLIATPQGEAVLAAGQRVELIDTGTPGVKVTVDAGGEALNLGRLMAESGRVGMVGAVVRQQGTTSAASLVREGGRIFLKATQKVELAAGSTTDASGTQGGTVEVDGGGTTTVAGAVSAAGTAAAGGRIELLGDKVGLLAGADVDASGASGGGTVLVGGDYQGGNADVRNAQISYLDRAATIRANALQSGDGGKVIVWADDTTRAYGTISARGGESAGDGGFVEVSGRKSLDFDASVNTLAPQGNAGTLLLDPNSVTIINGGGLPIGGADWEESGGATTLDWATIDAQLMTTDVQIKTLDSGGSGDDIYFMPGTPTAIVASATATRKLTLIADDNISFSTPMTLEGSLVATAGANIMFSSNVHAKGSFTASAGGDISLLRYQAISNGDMSFTAGGNISIAPSGGFGDAGLFMNKTGGSQIVTAGGTLSLDGGDLNTASGAYIVSAGSQQINANAITLTGGTNLGDNRAEIRSTGNQTVTATGNITLSGGSGNGVSRASIESGGSQTVSAVNISLDAGTGASDAGAFLEADGNQSITATGNVTLTGDANALNNEAGIASEATQTINITGDLELAGGGGSSAGAAMITAPTQNITVGGDVTMSAGNSTATGDYGMGAGAVIGWDAGANIALDIAGVLSMTGTNATNQAVIGAAVGNASVDITANAITTTANTTIGNWDGSSGGTVDLAASSGAISLPAGSTLRTGSLSASAGSSISMIGNHYANFVDLSANGPVSYYTSNTATTHIESIDAAGQITVVGNAGSTSIALGGLVTAGASNIFVTAQGQILDDNGSGTANLTTGSGNVALTSQAGTPTAGTLAISADVATSGQVTANVNGGPYGSATIRDVGANAVSYAGITVSAATAEGNVEYYRYGDLTIGSVTSLMLTPRTGAKTDIRASGNVVVDSSLSMTGSKDLLAAGGNLTFQSGTLTMSGDGYLGAGGNLSVTGGNVSLQGANNQVNVGGALSIAAGRTITAGMAGLRVSAGSISLAGTLSGFGDTFVSTTGALTVGGGNLTSTAGNLDFTVAGPMNVVGSVMAAQGILGRANGGLTLGAAAGGSGTMQAANGKVDLTVGGTGIAMHNGSWINSIDPTQAAGGLVRLFFPGLSAGGSLIDGAATFAGGYKIAGNFTTLGQGLEVRYGILSNPVSNAIVSATNTTTDSGGGTTQGSTSLALAGGASTTAATPAGGTTTQSTGGESGTFGNAEATAENGDASSGDSEANGGGAQETTTKQEDSDAKKKPALCTA